MSAAGSSKVRLTLRRLVQDVAANAVCVGRTTVTRMIGECGGEVTEADVTSALAKLDVRVAELPTLPAAAPTELPATLLETVHELGLRLSVQVVFANELIGGFRVLDGFVLDNGRGFEQVALAQAEQRAARLPTGPEREGRLAVLADLAAIAGTPGALDRVVLWEVVRLLRAPARDGLSQMDLAKQATMLHLVRDEAAVLAAALVEECGAPAPPGPPDVPLPREQPVPAAPPVQKTVPPPPAPAPPSAPAPPPAPAPPGEAEPPARPAPLPPGLVARPGRAGTLTVTWQAPSTGTVELRRSPDRPTRRRGETITAAQLRAYGSAEPTSGAVPTSDGRLRIDVEMPGARTFLTAFLRTADGAVVGDTVVLSNSEPVRDLQARRFGAEIRLRWGWPDGAVAAVVTWTPHGSAPQAQRCTRRAYFDGGGHNVAVDHTGGTVAVQAAFGYEAAQVLAPPVEITVPAEGVPVRYAIRPRPRRLPVGPRTYELHVTASSACLLPDLVVVAGHGRRMPETPVDGTTVGRLTGRAVDRDETVVATLDPSSADAVWLVCFVDDNGPVPGDEIALQPLSYAELRRR